MAAMSEPTLHERPEQPYAAIKVLVTMPELGAVVPPLNGEVFDWLAQHGVMPAGPPFWKYNVIDMARQLEIEAGVAVEQPITGDDRVTAGVLPAGIYATSLHVGHPDALIDATRDLLEWAAKEGITWDRTHSPEGERWAARLEFYLTDPADEPDMAKWETELAFRVADQTSAE
jgi:effector-binding domain-containing protein